MIYIEYIEKCIYIYNVEYIESKSVTHTDSHSLIGLFESCPYSLFGSKVVLMISCIPLLCRFDSGWMH